MGKKKGKKGKKGPELLTSDEALAPFDVKVRDIVSTPLGVECTVVGVRDGSLYLQWPGGIVSAATAAPQKVHDKSAMELYGYHRRPQRCVCRPLTLEERRPHKQAHNSMH